MVRIGKINIRRLRMLPLRNIMGIKLPKKPIKMARRSGVIDAKSDRYVEVVLHRGLDLLNTNVVKVYTSPDSFTRGQRVNVRLWVRGRKLQFAKIIEE